MTTATHNYGWLMPDPGGSANTWGNILNGTTQAIDAKVQAIGQRPGYAELPLAIQRGPDGGAFYARYRAFKIMVARLRPVGDVWAKPAKPKVEATRERISFWMPGTTAGGLLSWQCF